MSEQQSRTVGKALAKDGRMGYLVYEALVAQECAGCEQPIPVGAHFTRQLRQGGGRRRWPTCSACHPCPLEPQERYQQEDQGA